MIYEVNISRQAEEDLRGIYRYIASELLVPENAEGQLSRIEDCIVSLEEMPRRFCQYENEPWKSRGLPIVPVDNYCVLYIPDDEAMTVTIVRVMYNGRNIEKQLNDNTKM